MIPVGDGIGLLDNGQGLLTINRSDLVGTDPFTVNATGHFTDANVGENKTVIIDSPTMLTCPLSWSTVATVAPSTAMISQVTRPLPEPPVAV